jgi:hypothetical protein
MRAGEKMELTITPVPRPAETPALPGQSMFSRRPFAPQQILPPPGMRIGPEVWLGPRDPQKMMREMEEYFRQMQGGTDADQLLIQPDNVPELSVFSSAGNSAKQLSVSSFTDKDGKTKIQVTQKIQSGDSTEEKSWEAEKVDDLPDEIRGEIKKIFPNLK